MEYPDSDRIGRKHKQSVINTIGAGTNEFTLKKGFKELFGTTVFGFWNDLKMGQVHQLLLDKQYNVGEVSSMVGYKNQRHFATAFKRKFGITPSQLK